MHVCVSSWYMFYVMNLLLPSSAHISFSNKVFLKNKVPQKKKNMLCVCVYIYTHTHTYVCICTYTYIYIYIAHLIQECHNSKLSIFQKSTLNVLKVITCTVK